MAPRRARSTPSGGPAAQMVAKPAGSVRILPNTSSSDPSSSHSSSESDDASLESSIVHPRHVEHQYERRVERLVEAHLRRTRVAEAKAKISDTWQRFWAMFSIDSAAIFLAQLLAWLQSLLPFFRWACFLLFAITVPIIAMVTIVSSMSHLCSEKPALATVSYWMSHLPHLPDICVEVRQYDKSNQSMEKEMNKTFGSLDALRDLSSDLAFLSYMGAPFRRNAIELQVYLDSYQGYFADYARLQMHSTQLISTGNIVVDEAHFFRHLEAFTTFMLSSQIMLLISAGETMLENENAWSYGLKTSVEAVFYAIFPSAFKTSRYGIFILRHADFLQYQAEQIAPVLSKAEQLLDHLRAMDISLIEIVQMLGQVADQRRLLCETTTKQHNWWPFGGKSIDSERPPLCYNNVRREWETLEGAKNITSRLIDTVSQAYGNLTALHASIVWVGSHLNRQLGYAIEDYDTQRTFDGVSSFPHASLRHFSFSSARVALHRIVPSLKGLDAHLATRMAARKGVEVREAS